MRLLSFLLASSTYFGPTSPTGADLIKVQVNLYDAPTLGGVSLEEASFDDRNIPLQPTTLNGFRGGASFQLPPGSYELAWTVRVNPIVYPRTQNYRKTVEISPMDRWIQITVEGASASID
jgi:hypothetical protein